MASGLIGSEILKIAADVRALKREGRTICDLTVGDFDPKQFRIPKKLESGIRDALEKGETNYPPSNGVLELREAVQRFYARELGLDYPLDSFLIAGGARPVIYGIYRALVDAGDRVIYPVPSWNNNHYIHMSGAQGVPVVCTPEHAFLPTREDFAPHLRGARLVCLNSPLNPTGTAIEREVLHDICRAILEENRAREGSGGRPLFVMYDHIYWMLCVAGTEHVTPPELEPEMARYTVFVDGISKSFAATGVRVGWAVGPTDVIERMSAVLGHVGAWAPRAEQVATVALLDDAAGMKSYLDEFKRGVGARLARLHDGFQRLKAKGFAVESLQPMGAIYLTARIAPFGKTTPQGKRLSSSDDVRKHLLDAAGLAIVPFSAFGATADEGWFRLSVGAASLEAIDAALPRLEATLAALR
ncbi:MAG: aminotransferase class I/II-fold pyridoxal phosphate-dependent enzyme [Planctomycetes bacterium]|nr:aminotransferase class I/II-fold pyridoxal phosphate-dependent enzyme [Planctomycetota bacterium]